MAAKEFNQGVGSAPFNNLRIVTGESFIGGKLNVHTVRSNAIFGNNNCAIMGLPSVGKSSLAWEAVMAGKDELRQRKCLAVWLTAGAMSDSFDFYRRFYSELVKEYGRVSNPVMLENMISSLESVKVSNNIGDIREKLGDVIAALTDDSYKTVLVVDGFDNVQRYMSCDDFGWLREIFDLPNNNFTMLTTSRKTIAHIESISGSVSNFHQKFSPLYVGPFDDDSLKEYWEWAKPFLHVSDLEEYKGDAERTAGRFPVLLNLFNKYFYDDDREADRRAFEHELFTQFDAMERMLKEKEDLLDAAIQYVIGPVYNVKDEILTLIDYGFICEMDREHKDALLGQKLGPTMEGGVCYACFSDFFTEEFVRRHINDVHFWPEWQNTEKAMRDVILRYVTHVYGDEWEAPYEKAVEQMARNPYNGIDITTWRANFKNMKDNRALNQKRYQGASDCLTDYTSANTMFDLFVNPGWNDWFSQVFSDHGTPGNKRKWKERFDHLAKVRHPNAHCTEEILSTEDKRLATQYCQQILTAISRWEKAQEKLT